MSKYRTCPNCGCNLDHGERCDCENRTPAPQTAESAGALATPDKPKERAKPALDPALVPGA